MHAQVISFNCILRNKTGQVISTTYNREVLTVSGLSVPGLLSGLNKNLQNLKKGEKRIIPLLAEEALRIYEPKKVILFPRRKLPKTIRTGQTLQIVSKTNVERTYRILEIHNDFASLDGNHPLAGQDLIFEIEALEAREATADEIEESINMVSQQMLH